MDEFVGEKIDVQQAQWSPRPVRFTWRGEEHDVAEVLRVWVDAGFGDLSPRSRKWFNRRHRRHYVVKDSQGQVYQMYLDYANRQKRTWWLVKKLT